ncbi:MAG: M20/M25/M40 family metallo-hydrolase [Chloroflexi bacterium]|nr:M20/M25/M40 family metallo-hydrolase [Chloroflexota bacterium]
MHLDRVHAHIDNQFQRHLAKAQEFLQKPSISAERVGLSETAEWLVRHIKPMAGTIELVQGRIAPLIITRLISSKPKTLLVYGMYDVQPVEPSLWSSPPFGAEIHKIDNEDAIIARGACNSKGPLIGFLNAVQAIIESDELPLNLILAIEGEEEIGSFTISEYFARNKGQLKADAALDPFWAEYGTDVDRPTLTLGTKGVLTVDLIVRGGEWGGPIAHPVHSSVAGWLASPVWRLVKVLATIINDNEEVLVEGLQDEIQVSPEDEQLLSSLAASFNGQRILSIEGASRFKWSLQPIDLLRKYFFSTTVSVGISTQTESDIIPTEARARLVLRLTPGMHPVAAFERLQRHLLRNGYPDIQLEFIQGYPGTRVSMHEPVVQSMIKAYRYHGHEPQVLPLSASATPYYLFTDVLGIPYVWGGLGRAGRSHAPDEFATVEGLRIFEKSVATFLYMFADS